VSGPTTIAGLAWFRACEALRSSVISASSSTVVLFGGLVLAQDQSCWAVRVSGWEDVLLPTVDASTTRDLCVVRSMVAIEHAAANESFSGTRASHGLPGSVPGQVASPCVCPDAIAAAWRFCA
jgi:hypothetical protein